MLTSRNRPTRGRHFPTRVDTFDLAKPWGRRVAFQSREILRTSRPAHFRKQVLPQLRTQSAHMRNFSSAKDGKRTAEEAGRSCWQIEQLLTFSTRTVPTQRSPLLFFVTHRPSTRLILPVTRSLRNSSRAGVRFAIRSAIPRASGMNSSQKNRDPIRHHRDFSVFFR
jgi:hypothetical protein